MGGVTSTLTDSFHMLIKHRLYARGWRHRGEGRSPCPQEADLLADLTSETIIMGYLISDRKKEKNPWVMGRAISDKTARKRLWEESRLSRGLKDIEPCDS